MTIQDFNHGAYIRSGTDAYRIVALEYFHPSHIERVYVRHVDTEDVMILFPCRFFHYEVLTEEEAFPFRLTE